MSETYRPVPRRRRPRFDWLGALAMAAGTVAGYLIAEIVRGVFSPAHVWRAATAPDIATAIAHVVLAVFSVVYTVRTWRNLRTAIDVARDVAP